MIIIMLGSWKTIRTQSITLTPHHSILSPANFVFLSPTSQYFFYHPSPYFLLFALIPQSIIAMHCIVPDRYQLRADLDSRSWKHKTPWVGFLLLLLLLLLPQDLHWCQSYPSYLFWELQKFSDYWISFCKCAPTAPHPTSVRQKRKIQDN